MNGSKKAEFYSSDIALTVLADSKLAVEGQSRATTKIQGLEALACPDSDRSDDAVAGTRNGEPCAIAQAMGIVTHLRIATLWENYVHGCECFE